jgi:demethylmenaquinone methyltransferase/2-methoxy-6-polyprenyl-1,4-benzoquinol methylase
MSEIERVPRTEQEAAASYTRLSRWYDRLGRSSEGPHITEGLRLLNVQPGERVLEIGFGTGHSLVTLAHAIGSTGQVIGIDLSPGMIDVARKQLRKGNTPNGVTLNRGSALHLPYAAASFDAVFSSFMLDLIDTPDIPIVLCEMRRVLKPNGRLGLVSMSKACASNVIVKVYERFHRWLPKLIDCRPIYLQNAVKSAGLHCEAQHSRSMWGIPVEIVIAANYEG